MSAAFGMTQLQATLKRGALITAANWPVIGVQFMADAIFKLLLGVPLVGGAILLALAAGTDLWEELAAGWQSLLTSITTGLLSEPVSFAAFLTAFLLALAAGSVFTFLIKAGVVWVLVSSEGAAGPIERPPLRGAALRDASRADIETFLVGCRRFFPRYLRVGVLLLLGYGVIGGAYLSTMLVAFRGVEAAGAERTFVAASGSAVFVACLTVLNLLYLLVQIVIAMDDVGVRAAIGRVRILLRARLVPLGSVFGVVLAIVGAATVLSTLALASLGLVSFVPIVGIIVIPLQLVVWLLRGLLFQYIGLAALVAYASIHREWKAEAEAARPRLVKGA